MQESSKSIPGAMRRLLQAQNTSDKLCSMNSSSSVMAPFFANQSCDPWTSASQPCELGNYVRYAVNVTGPDDIAATIKFANDKNIRLIIRNTGM